MTPAIELTSVPGWAVAPSRPGADLTGRYWTVVAFDDGPTDGGAVTDVVAAWAAQIADRHPGCRPRIHLVADDPAALRAFTGDLATALVGWRLMIAGPADACLRLRAQAIGHGIGDDEITVASTMVRRRDVHCAHCRSVTRAVVDLEGALRCAGCGLTLIVHQHVSRRIGAHLGVMAVADDTFRDVSA